MSAMPERVWLHTDGDWTNADPTGPFAHEYAPIDVPYVPESRLREVEAGHQTVMDYLSRKNDRLKEENAALRADLKAAQELEQLHLQNLDAAYAERDALVPLLRYFVEYVEDGTYDDEDGGQTPTHDCDFIGNPESGYCEFHDKWGTARAILAREVGE